MGMPRTRGLLQSVQTLIESNHFTRNTTTGSNSTASSADPYIPAPDDEKQRKRRLGKHAPRAGYALRDRLLQTTTPELGILRVELLPSSLSHKSAGNKEAFTARGTGMAVSATDDTRPGSWISANGLPCPPHGLGSRVVDYFLRSGNLGGAGGHVFYESVRGGSQGGGARKNCFVSLAGEVRILFCFYIVLEGGRGQSFGNPLSIFPPGICTGYTTGGRGGGGGGVR